MVDISPRQIGLIKDKGMTEQGPDQKDLRYKLSRATINFLTLFGFAITIYFGHKAYRMNLFTSEAALQRFLEGAGPLAPIIFILIQIVQTVIPIIPGALTCPAGAMIFGVGRGFLLNWFAIMIGSVMNFFLARRFGRPLVRALVGDKNYKQGMGWLNDGQRFDKLFTFGMFFPVSPADFLCMLAGLSSMSFKKYFLILSLGKPITLYLYTYGITEVIKFAMGFLG